MHGSSCPNNPYLKEEWTRFRAEIIELDDGLCRKCRRSPIEGAILQVHHLKYIPGRLPWAYSYRDCETLCKGCHAVEHGIIRPSVGWTYLGDEDLGDLSGACENCGTEIRYVFHIQHPHWEPLAVGTVCCDNLTETQIASNHVESLKRFRSRQSRFVCSKRWKESPTSSFIRQKQIAIEIKKVGPSYRIQMGAYLGKQIFSSCEAAKQLAFAVIDDGRAEAYLQARTHRGGPAAGASKNKSKTRLAN